MPYPTPKRKSRPDRPNSAPEFPGLFRFSGSQAGIEGMGR